MHSCFLYEQVLELETFKNVHALHNKDLNDGFGSVYLPKALSVKYKNADKEFKWQYVFPGASISVDPRSGVKRRHHVHLSTVNKALKKAGNLAYK